MEKEFCPILDLHKMHIVNSLTIPELVMQSHGMAREKGFWDNAYMYEGDDELYTSLISEKLMLIVSEVSEALEALRHEDQKEFNEEMADIMIRVADLCGKLKIDLNYEIVKKMEKNASRPYKHGKKF